ncbi:hypothetical protein J6590_091943 [Homalodisca vitripennis]|nr:hypothetical protein J6590_091943 [Homalodisca vitripennis]
MIRKSLQEYENNLIYAGNIEDGIEERVSNNNLVIARETCANSWHEVAAYSWKRAPTPYPLRSLGVQIEELFKTLDFRSELQITTVQILSVTYFSLCSKQALVGTDQLEENPTPLPTIHYYCPLQQGEQSTTQGEATRLGAIKLLHDL